VIFSKAPQACNECHQDPHGHQFAARENDCASCHNASKWKPSLFDHEKTAFSLKGGHQSVACGACHTVKKEVEGDMVLFYKPTPSACADCHGTKIPKDPGIAMNLGPKLLPDQLTNGRDIDAAKQSVGICKRAFLSTPANLHHVSLSKKSRNVSFSLLP